MGIGELKDGNKAHHWTPAVQGGVVRLPVKVTAGTLPAPTNAPLGNAPVGASIDVKVLTFRVKGSAVPTTI